MMKFNLKEFREKLNVEPPPGAPPKTTPGFSDVAVVKIGVKKMAFRGKSKIIKFCDKHCPIRKLVVGML